MIRKYCDDKRVLSAISALEHNEDFKLIRLWLESELAELRKDNDSEQGVHLSWNQGACQALSAVVKIIDTARETIKAMETNVPRAITKPTWV